MSHKHNTLAKKALQRLQSLRKNGHKFINNFSSYGRIDLPCELPLYANQLFLSVFTLGLSICLRVYLCLLYPSISYSSEIIFRSIIHVSACKYFPNHLCFTYLTKSKCSAFFMSIYLSMPTKATSIHLSTFIYLSASRDARLTSFPIR